MLAIYGQIMNFLMDVKKWCETNSKSKKFVTIFNKIGREFVILHYEFIYLNCEKNCSCQF